MKRALLIAEKPSLMRTIQETYKEISGLDYKITKFMAQAGHLVRLLLPSELDETQKIWSWENLPFYPEEHGGWKYRIIEGKTGLFNDIKKEINSGNYDFIIHCGDPDAEGQLLVQLVLNECKNKLPVKRFWSNDLTPKAIENGLRNLKDNDNDPFLINLYHAALSRQKTDYLYGMNLSQAISLKTRQTMPIGRVKTPVTKIIVDRENEIANFKPTTTYEVSVDYKLGFSGTMFDEKGNTSFETSEDAKKIINSLPKKAKVFSVEKKEEKTNPPAYYKLSTLQIAAGKAFGYNADKVLELAQSLYEKKVLSYPRTSCEFLSSATDFDALLKSASAIPELVPFIKKITAADIKAITSNKRYCNDKKLQEAGHSALMLTEIAPKGLTADEMNIYIMVAKQLIASFMDPLIENKTIIITEINDKKFKSNGKVLVSKGYTELLTKKSDDVELPNVKKDEILDVDKFNVDEKTTTCPSRYTDADIIALMEGPSKFLIDKTLKDNLSGKLKIGTEATRATEIKDICGKTGFAEKKKGKGKNELIYALPKSMNLIAQIKQFEITSVDMTAKLEYKLDLIKIGDLKPDEYYKEMKADVAKQVKAIKAENMSAVSTNSKKVLGKCPSCGGDIVLGERSVFCSNWKEKECRSGFPKILLGAKLTDNDIEKLIAGKTITKTLKKDDKSWKQQLKLSPTYSIEFVKDDNVDEDMLCPECGMPIRITDKCYSCSDRECNFVIWNTVCNARITKADAKKLIEGKRVRKTMVSKAGKEFEGYLVLKDGKVSIEFE